MGGRVPLQAPQGCPPWCPPPPSSPRAPASPRGGVVRKGRRPAPVRPAACGAPGCRCSSGSVSFSVNGMTLLVLASRDSRSDLPQGSGLCSPCVHGPRCWLVCQSLAFISRPGGCWGPSVPVPGSATEDVPGGRAAAPHVGARQWGGAQDPCVDRSAGPRLQGASAEDAGVLTAPTAPAQPDSGWGGGGSPPVLSPSG